MKKALILLGVICIYFAFLPALVLVWLSMFYHLASFNKDRIEVVFNAMNRLVSTLFGGDGTRSTSHTSGVKLIFNEGDWRHCVLCKSLDFFDPNHCIKEAQDDPRVKELNGNLG
jgi:hypothetical protein